MHDPQAYGALPKNHWIHKALARTKKGVPAAKKAPTKTTPSASNITGVC